MTQRDSVTLRPGQQRNKECSQGCWPPAGQQELGEAPLVVSPVQHSRSPCVTYAVCTMEDLGWSPLIESRDNGPLCWADWAPSHRNSNDLSNF